MERVDIITDAFKTLKIKGFVHSQRDFASLLGVNEATISKALKGDAKYLTDSLMSKVSALMSEKTGAEEYSWMQVQSQDNASPYSLPVIPTEAMAGTLGEFADSIQGYDCEKMVSPIKDVDYAIKVCGDSMSPEIPNGSQILVKRIYEEEFVEWGKIFCLDTRNGAVIKKIFPTDNPEVIECRSVNPDFPPFKVNVRHINGWYRVLMVLSLK